MSFSGISSSQLNSVLDTLLETDKKANSTTGTNSTASTASAASTSSAVDNDSIPSATNTTLTQELASLLKALATGDVAGAKQDLTTLKTQLANTESAAASTKTTDPASPLNKLISTLSDALSKGDTSGALNDVASYLLSSGQSKTGTLVDTTA